MVALGPAGQLPDLTGPLASFWPRKMSDTPAFLLILCWGTGGPQLASKRGIAVCGDSASSSISVYSCDLVFTVFAQHLVFYKRETVSSFLVGFIPVPMPSLFHSRATTLPQQNGPYRVSGDCCEQNSLPLPTRVLKQMGFCLHLEGWESRVPEGVMSLSLPIASTMIFPNEKAIQEVVKKQSHLSMLHPGMLQWLNLATSTCQLNPQVTSGHGPQATSCPPWHSFYLPLFKRIHIRCVFYIVRDFLELGGSPTPFTWCLNFSFCTNGSGPKTLLTLDGDFYNKCIN